ncbi:MAG: hypothetical protein F4202_00720 [Cenarchaeum sp. SB0677_bin_16]|nr:hypothetical protein [Cenarchaeum sp. SB0677_bin_16]
MKKINMPQECNTYSNEKAQPVCLSNNRFAVPSQSQKGVCYEVIFLDGWRCTCPHHVKRYVDCKHITAVQKMVIDTRKLEPIQFEKTKPEPTCSNNECRSTDCRYYDEYKRKDGATKGRTKTARGFNSVDPPLL